MCYHNMRGRVFGIQKEKAHLYKGLELMGRREFYVWALTSPTYKRLFAAWVKAGYSRALTPSVNRVDSKKGYVAGNIEWVTHSENSSMGAKTKRGKVYDRKAV